MTIKHNKNPRETLIESDNGRSGISLYLTRNGLYFNGHYDTFVGIMGGYISWEKFDELRAAAKKPYKEVANDPRRG